jgi:hypothetical protein
MKHMGKVALFITILALVAVFIVYNKTIEGFGGGGGRGGGGRGGVRGGYGRGIHRGGGWWGRGGGYNYLPFYYGYEYPSYVVTDYDPYYYQYFKNLRWF